MRGRSRSFINKAQPFLMKSHRVLIYIIDLKPLQVESNSQKKPSRFNCGFFVREFWGILDFWGTRRGTDLFSCPYPFYLACVGCSV